MYKDYRVRRFFLIVSVILCVGTGTLSSANAQSRPLSFVRDAEIETTIAAFAEPLLHAAGLVPSAVNIVLVQDGSLNAFVAGGQNIFINTGLLLAAESPLEVIGVLAHEIGHLAGGHLARGREAIERSQRTALVTAIIGVAAAVASGSPDIGAAAIVGGQASAQTSFFAFTQAMENSADQAALTYLDQSGQSAEGLLAFMEVLEDQDLLPASAQTPYTRTHPLTRDRVSAIRAHTERSIHTGTASSEAEWEAFRRMQTKLLAYLAPQRALRALEDDQSPAARYGRAVANWRRGDLGAAIDLMEGLSSEEPGNPFFAEFLGQLWLERGRTDLAVQYLSQAASGAPESALIHIELAQAEIAANLEQQAIAHLEHAVLLPGGESPLAFRLLATAYGRSGDLGLAALNLALEALARGDAGLALSQAQRAIDQLPQGAPGRLRAQDIIATAR